MVDTNNSIDIILQQELTNQSKFERFVSNKSMIKSKMKLARPRQLQKLMVSEKEFKPDLIVNTVILFLVFVLCLSTFKIVIDSPTKDKIPLFVMSLFYALVTFSFTRQFYFDKKLNYQIYLNKDGIEIDKQFFEWIKIADTAIFFKGQARGSKKFLIIRLTEDNSYQRFDLTNFDLWGAKNFSVKLSNYIEFFKPK